MESRRRKTDWLATVFYPLAVVLMEAFWVYPWLVWIGSWPVFFQPRPPLSLASIIIVLAGAVLAVRWLLRPQWPVKLSQFLIIGAGLVIILLVTGAEHRAGYAYLGGAWFGHLGRAFGNILSRPDTMVVAPPLLLYLWWRGLRLGQATSYFRGIYFSFVLGMVALIVLNIIWQVSAASGDFARPGSGVGVDIIAFFFFGLLAIAISHLYQMRSTMPREEAGLTPVWRWLPVMLIVIGGMALVVFGIAGVFSPGFFTSIGHAFGTAFDFFWKILNYVLIPFNFIFEGLLWIMRWLVNLLRRSQPPQPDSTANMSSQNIFPETTPKELPPVFYLVTKWVFIAVLIGLVLFFLAKAISRYRARQAGEEIEEIHESILSWRGLGDDLKEFFGLMGKKFRRRPPPPSPHQYGDDEPGRLDVREAYRRMLYEASRSGFARRRHETPEEYARRTGNIILESREPLAHLTDIYVNVRYGETRPPADRVAAANSLWRTLRSLFRGMRGEKP